ncbi:putative WRKY transcription factor 70 [Platanthera guangdongensis]|uniref:WRKY transcription factor 70 n=1 Tax=Platanthera guangdongensis TaxID=2320717 RepID=A0ABR2LTT7_9ASPA
MSFREEYSLRPPAWSAAIKDLAHGRDSVAKLASLLQLCSPENQWPGTATAALLVEEIMGSITKAMAALDAGNVMAANQTDSPSSCVTSYKQCAGVKRKTQGTRTAVYRKRGNPYSWTRITSATIDDQHTWRKYGQKEIYSATYPRSYFRCTHKYSQDCRASKQVQRSEEDPALFVITYFGEHTCADTKKSPMASLRDPCIISFESTNGGNRENGNPSSLQPLKQESEEEAVSNISSADVAEIAGGYNESASGLHSFFNYGMDVVNFEDLFRFDLTEFLQD